MVGWLGGEGGGARRDGGVDWERNGKPTLDHLSKASYNPSRENFSKENSAHVSFLF